MIQLRHFWSLATASLDVFSCRCQIRFSSQQTNFFKTNELQRSEATGFQIGKLKPSEYAIVVNWARRERWVVGDNDLELFSEIDADGLFAGRIKDELVSFLLAVNFSDEYSHRGLLITKPEHRGKGYGSKMINTAIQHNGSRFTEILSVAPGKVQYNFRPCANVDFYGLDIPIKDDIRIFKSEESRIVRLSDVPLNELMAFDRKYFPAVREKFLKKWISQPNSSALACVNGDRHLLGYGVMRKMSETQSKIGPLYADTASVADNIFQAFCRLKKTGKILIDGPDNNVNMAGFVQRFGLECLFSTSLMCRNGPVRVAGVNGVFGITTPEIG